MKRDERGRLRVKTVWVKFWICDMYIQICSNGFCSDGFCKDVGGVFCNDGLLKIPANDGFCVCFAIRHGLIFIFWVQMGWMWQWSGGFFFFSFLIWVFGSDEILVGSGQCGHGGGGVVVMIGLFGCWERDRDSERQG